MNLDASGIDAKQAKAIDDIVGQSVSRAQNLTVMTVADVGRIADVDAKKELMGCDQDGCMAQLAGAFGARYVVYGSVAVLGELYVVQLTLFDSDVGQALRRSRVETTNLADMTKRIDEGVDDVLSPIATLGAPPASGVSPGPWLTAGGAAAVVVGAVLVAVGVQPALAHGTALEDINAAEAAFDADADAALVDAKDAQGRAATASSDWDGYGALTTGIGGALVVAGAVVTTVGALLWTGTLGGTE